MASVEMTATRRNVTLAVLAAIVGIAAIVTIVLLTTRDNGSGSSARPARTPLSGFDETRVTVKTPSAALSRWVAWCREQLEGLTAKEPSPPTDFRRPAEVTCKCGDCRELAEFLADPREQVHRFPVAQGRRDHLQNTIRNDHLDVDCRTEERGRPYTLVCTKNTRSYQESVKKYQRDQEHLAAVRAIEAALPG